MPTPTPVELEEELEIRGHDDPPVSDPFAADYDLSTVYPADERLVGPTDGGFSGADGWAVTTAYGFPGVASPETGDEPEGEGG